VKTKHNALNLTGGGAELHYEALSSSPGGMAESPLKKKKFAGIARRGGSVADEARALSSTLGTGPY
jgi:hypothetical protein